MGITSFLSKHLRHELLGEVLGVGGHAGRVGVQDLLPVLFALEKWQFTSSIL
jgi:hypothetical protein